MTGLIDMDFFSHPFSIEAALRLLLVACAAFIIGVAWVPILGAYPGRNHGLTEGEGEMIYFLFWPVWLAGFLLGLWERRGSIRSIVSVESIYFATAILTLFSMVSTVAYIVLWSDPSPIHETKPVITMQNQQDGRDSLIALSSDGIYAAYSPTSSISIPILSRSIPSATTITSFIVSESIDIHQSDVTIDGGNNAWKFINGARILIHGDNVTLKNFKFDLTDNNGF